MWLGSKIVIVLSGHRTSVISLGGHVLSRLDAPELRHRVKVEVTRRIGGNKDFFLMPIRGKLK
jgi:hypothetical protein